ncbi:MAG TPA: glycoside hydrolase family 5 protein, partial [Chloroflexota bacterium]
LFGQPATTVTERDRHRDMYAVLQRGPLVVTLRLRLNPHTSAAGTANGLWYFWHVGQVSNALATHLFTDQPPTTAPTQPAVSVAPWGTGPVVKSPSLLAPGAAPAGAHAVLDGGVFRPGASPLAARAANQPALVPAGTVSRYVETSNDPGHGRWYESTSLFPSAQDAAAAWSSLAARNNKAHWLKSLPLEPGLWKRGYLSLSDAAQAWQGSGEAVYLLRTQNVLVALAAAPRQTIAMAAVAQATMANVPTWFQAQGASIVDGAGNHIQPAALNWYGADQQDFVVGGLDFVPYQTILTEMQSLGYSTIRIPFSNQLVEQNPVITAHIGANPELAGLHALDILDRIINYAGALGMSVILDDHRSEAGWSAEANGLWYTDAYPDSSFVADWSALAQRYAVNDVVVGADLRNEPHGPATWGDGNPSTDWLAAAERAGNAILSANPHLLIMVEGVQFYNGSQSYWWGGNLMGVQTHPVVLQFADGASARDRLVYSVHDYGPDNCASGCPWFNAATTPSSLMQTWEQYWGYITDNPAMPYAAPVWIGEFGTCNTQATCVSDTAPGSQGQWFSSLVQYLASKHLPWAYWSANGTQSTAGTRVYGALDWYGFFSKDWKTPVPWIQQSLHQIGGGAPGTRS